MAEQATFHEGYRKALEEVSSLVSSLRDGHAVELGNLLEEIDKRIERARCLSRSSMASLAGGKNGY